MSGKPFDAPDFRPGAELEFRFDEGEVQVYGTEAGLRALAKHCDSLANDIAARPAHVHLEDYMLLTKRSLRAVLAIFRQAGGS